MLVVGTGNWWAVCGAVLRAESAQRMQLPGLREDKRAAIEKSGDQSTKGESFGFKIK